MTQPARRALALVSGGLDSALAMKLLLDQGIELVAVHFVNPFDDPQAAEGGRAKRNAARMGVPFKLVAKGPDFVSVLREPRHGYGSGVNPCIDCRIYTFSKARELMAELGASFLVSGEVLGQRPMSQMRPQLGMIERQAGLEGLLLRPLSAKLLEPTLPEQDGRVDRERLLDISGRSRARQLALAREYGLRGITSGAGGCLLTDVNYAKRVRDLYEFRSEIELADYRLLAVGRHFRLDPETKLIASRMESECDKLLPFVTPGRTLYVPESFAGPSVLLEGAATARNERRALQLLASYSKLKEHERGPLQSVAVHRHAEAVTIMEFAWEENDKADWEASMIK